MFLWGFIFQAIHKVYCLSLDIIQSLHPTSVIKLRTWNSEQVFSSKQLATGAGWRKSGQRPLRRGAIKLATWAFYQVRHYKGEWLLDLEHVHPPTHTHTLQRRFEISSSIMHSINACLPQKYETLPPISYTNEQTMAFLVKQLSGHLAQIGTPEYLKVMS